jgi:hypothetical protein
MAGKVFIPPQISPMFTWVTQQYAQLRHERERHLIYKLPLLQFGRHPNCPFYQHFAEFPQKQSSEINKAMRKIVFLGDRNSRSKNTWTTPRPMTAKFS